MNSTERFRTAEKTRIYTRSTWVQPFRVTRQSWKSPGPTSKVDPFPPTADGEMYNGIGLTTPRGSGTNGYVQRNLSSIRAKRSRDERGDERDEKDREKLESQLSRQPNAGILEHQRKRQLEVKCAELQDMMEEQGYSAEEIEEKVNSFRLMLLEKQEPPPPVTDRSMVTETHALAAANQQKNDRLREAFGIATDYVDGSSFHPERAANREKEIS
ncbi:hypothetical protein GJAV_G00214470 [Gymnothorax javanicus]|nr:hypothetical protein GJAV_G00214470 [Gymnothorax javanicus]